MAGLADIKINRADGADAPAPVKPGVRREIVIPASIDKYRDAAPSEPAKAGRSLSDFLPSMPNIQAPAMGNPMGDIPAQAPMPEERTPEPDGLRPDTTSDLDTFARAYGKNSRIYDAVQAVAKAQRERKASASILDRAEPSQGYDEAALTAASNLPRLRAQQDAAIADGRRQSMTSGDTTILPTGGIGRAAQNIPGNTVRTIGSTVLKGLAVAPDLAPAIYPEGTAQRLRSAAAGLDQTSAAANNAVSDQPLFRTGNRVFDGLVPSAKDVSTYVPEGVKQLAEALLIGPHAIIADAGVQGFDKARTDGLGAGMSLGYGGAQALTEGVPEALAAKFATHALDNVPLRKLISGDAKTLTAAAQQTAKAMGLEFGSEELSSFGNWAADKLFADPTATPERLKQDLQDAFKATLIQGPTMIGGGKALQAAASRLQPTDRRIEALRAAGDNEAADALQRTLDARAAQGELGALAGVNPDAPFSRNPSFHQAYTGLRAEGVKPAEAAARAAMTSAFDTLGKHLQIGQKAIDAAVEAVRKLPIDKIPAALDRYVAKLTAGGMGKPTEPGAVETVVDSMRDQATTAVVDGIYQPKPKPQEAGPVPADEVLGQVEGDGAQTPLNQDLENAAHQAATSPISDVPEPTDAQKKAGNYKMGHIRLHGLDISIENPRGSTRRGVSREDVDVKEIVKSRGTDGQAAVEDILGQVQDALDAGGEVIYHAEGKPNKIVAIDRGMMKDDKGQRWGTMLLLTDKGGKNRLEVAKPWENHMHSHYGYIRGTEGADGDHVDTFVGPNPDSTKVFVVDQVNKDGTFDEHKVMLGFDSQDEADRGYHANYEPGWTGRGAITQVPMEDFKAWLKSGVRSAPISGQQIPAAATAPAPSQPAATAAPAQRKRSRVAGTRSAAYDKNPMMAFLGNHGLFHEKDNRRSLKTEFSPDANIMIPGHGPVFRSKGLHIDQLLPIAIQDGFLPPDADESDLYELVRRAIGGERIAPTYGDGQAETELERRMADRDRFDEPPDQAQNDAPQEDVDAAAGALANVDDETLVDLDADIPDIGAKATSNTDMAAAMRSLGFTEEEISDALAKEQTGAQGDGERGGVPAETVPAPAQGRPERGDEEARPESKANPEGLTPPVEPERLPPRGNPTPNSEQTPPSGGVSASGDANSSTRGEETQGEPQQPAAAPEPAPAPTPQEQRATKERETVELRKRLSVLRSIRKCLTT